MSSQASKSFSFTPEPTKSMLKPPREAQYLITEVGPALKQGLNEVVQKMPRDPIEYLAHFLYKFADSVLYHQNMALLEKLTQEEAIRHEEEVRLEIERARERKRLEEEEKLRQEEARQREAAEKQQAAAEAQAKLLQAQMRDEHEFEGGVAVTITEAADEDIENADEFAEGDGAGDETKEPADENEIEAGEGDVEAGGDASGEGATAEDIVEDDVGAEDDNGEPAADEE